MHDSSIFKIRIDFDKSRDSFIFDKNTGQYFLDFFGLYASVPLGYSHPIFRSEEFRLEFNRVAAIKVPNCEVISDEAQEFLKEFSSYPSMRGYSHFYFCCTGALAIEAAIKIAMDRKQGPQPVVLSFRESFHGINGYGGFVTDRFFPVSIRLDGFPHMGWPKLHTPKIIYGSNGVDEAATRRGMERFEADFAAALKEFGATNIAALLVEPIQATYGDNFYPPGFFVRVRQLCDAHQIALIFDEIQTGFGPSGTLWYFEQTPVRPDIVVFGKKLQVSGVMATQEFGTTFKTPVRLEVTFDGNLTDMVRAKYILRAYQQYDLLDNARRRGHQLLEGLRKIPGILHPRGCGLLLAFDFSNGQVCGEFFDKAVGQRFLCNKTRGTTIRLRPNLNVSPQECEDALAIIRRCVS